MSSVADAQSLFAQAHEDDVLGLEAMQSLGNIPDLGARINDALGVPADQLQSSEVVLVSIMADDSGSISASGLTEAIRDGHNAVIEALVDSKSNTAIQFYSRLLNGQLIQSYGPIDSANRLDDVNYNPRLGTPLFDGTIEFLGAVMAKAQEYADNGIPCRTVSLIQTDGFDMHSRSTARNVEPLIRDMRKQETHIVCGFGVEDAHGGFGSGTSNVPTTFREVFKSMGIADEWIMEATKRKPDGSMRTPEEFKSEVRRMFQVFSQSAIRASQNAASFSQQALGGLGA